LQHFAVYTDDIETTATRFRQAGGSLLKGPNNLLGIEKGEGNKWMYGKTPGEYEQHTPLRRWKP
jgi:hypothetical protein